MWFTVKEVFTILGCTLITSACGVGNQTSPWQYGVEARISPAIITADSGHLSLHATVAYARYFLGGIDGEHDEVINIGGQIRFIPGESREGFWVSLEPSYARRKTVVDDPAVADPADEGSTNGWSFSALGGLPLMNGRVASVSGYVALGIVKFGGTGPNLRVGFDIQPEFLRR